MAGIAVRALRVSYVGELGWELHVPLADMAASYDRAPRRPAGPSVCSPFGAYAMNALRLEKGYRAWGLDLTSERTPLEAGLGFLVRPEGRSFIGREALLARAEKTKPGAWRSSSSSHDDPRALRVLTASAQGGRPVGIVTSAAFGPRTAKSLALAYLTPAAEHGPLRGPECSARPSPRGS